MYATFDNRSYIGMPVSSKEAAVLEVMMARTLRVHLVDHPDQRFFVEPTKFYDIAGKLYLMYPSVSDMVDLDSCIGSICSNVRMLRATVAGICRALRSVHKHGMVHGGLNPRCVTIDSTGGVRVMLRAAPVAVTRYTPPEDARSAAGDMWALGTMLMDMCGGPEGRLSPHADSLRDLATCLTATDPATRMSAQSALAHRAFDGVTAEATLAFAATAAPPVQIDRHVPIPMARPLSFH